MSQSRSLMDRELDELYGEAHEIEKRGKRVGTIRRVLAYGLKLVAGGASLVVAFSFWPDANQACGVAAVLAIFVDTVTSNHKRLLGSVQAGYAAEALRNSVKRSFNRQLGELLPKLEAAEDGSEVEQDLEDKIEKLKGRAHENLTAGIAEVRDRLAALDVAALETLSLDPERAATSKQAGDA